MPVWGSVFSVFSFCLLSLSLFTSVASLPKRLFFPVLAVVKPPSCFICSERHWDWWATNQSADGVIALSAINQNRAHCPSIRRQRKHSYTDLLNYLEIREGSKSIRLSILFLNAYLPLRLKCIGLTAAENAYVLTCMSCSIVEAHIISS